MRRNRLRTSTGVDHIERRILLSGDGPEAASGDPAVVAGHFAGSGEVSAQAGDFAGSDVEESEVAEGHFSGSDDRISNVETFSGSDDAEYLGTMELGQSIDDDLPSPFGQFAGSNDGGTVIVGTPHSDVDAASPVAESARGFGGSNDGPVVSVPLPVSAPTVTSAGTTFTGRDDIEVASPGIEETDDDSPTEPTNFAGSNDGGAVVIPNPGPQETDDDSPTESSSFAGSNDGGAVVILDPGPQATDDDSPTAPTSFAGSNDGGAVVIANPSPQETDDDSPTESSSFAGSNDGGTVVIANPSPQETDDDSPTESSSFAGSNDGGTVVIANPSPQETDDDSPTESSSFAGSNDGGTVVIANPSPQETDDDSPTEPMSFAGSNDGGTVVIANPSPQETDDDSPTEPMSFAGSDDRDPVNVVPPVNSTGSTEDEVLEPPISDDSLPSAEPVVVDAGIDSESSDTPTVTEPAFPPLDDADEQGVNQDPAQNESDELDETIGNDLLETRFVSLSPRQQNAESIAEGKDVCESVSEDATGEAGIDADDVEVGSEIEEGTVSPKNESEDIPSSETDPAIPKVDGNSTPHDPGGVAAGASSPSDVENPKASGQPGPETMSEEHVSPRLDSYLTTSASEAQSVTSSNGYTPFSANEAESLTVEVDPSTVTDRGSIGVRLKMVLLSLLSSTLIAATPASVRRWAGQLFHSKGK